MARNTLENGMMESKTAEGFIYIQMDKEEKENGNMEGD